MKGHQQRQATTCSRGSFRDANCPAFRLVISTLRLPLYYSGTLFVFRRRLILAIDFRRRQVTVEWRTDETRREIMKSAVQTHFC